MRHTARMRVLLAPDCFTGTLTAAEAAAAIRVGWRSVHPDDELAARPMSDGGPGFLDAIEAGLGGTRHDVVVRGPLGEPVSAQYLVTDRTPAGTDAERAGATLGGAAAGGLGGADGVPIPDIPVRPGPARAAAGPVAWIESAQAAGLHLVPQALRDPTLTTSWGVGELMLAAVKAGARRLVVGVGGTGTCDGGAGMLAAMGATGAPDLLGRGGVALAGLGAVDLSGARSAVAGLELLIASDVDVPLLGPRGAAHGFAPQKGARPDQVELLESALGHLCSVVGESPPGRHPEVGLGAGAGGGLGYGLMLLGGTRVAGIETVMTATGLAEQARTADLVITGEGALDWQSMTGKVVTGVARLAAQWAVPTIVLAGRVEVGRPELIEMGVAAAYGVLAPGSPPPPPTAAPRELAALAARVARTWGRR